MTSVADRFTSILDGFRRAVANQWRPRPAYPPLGMRIWHFVGWTLHRLPRALERARQGWTPPQPRPGRDRSGPGQRRPTPPPKSDRAIATRALRLPLTDGWLLRRVPTPHHVAVYGSLLEHLFSDPEIAPLLSSPQVNRLLRPICRMVGIPHRLPPPAGTQPPAPPASSKPTDESGPATPVPPHAFTRPTPPATPEPGSSARPPAPRGTPHPVMPCRISGAA